VKFSHLVEINDPGNIGIEPLSREQLWRGLVARAEKPTYFLIGLDECAILSRGENSLTRQLRFGNLVVRDSVWFEPPRTVRYEIAASTETPGGRLVMRIEEPESGRLFLRFEYELLGDETRMDDYYNEFRKSAYVESDIDTVRMIRQLAASELL
jgi:hypothetical protein